MLRKACTFTLPIGGGLYLEPGGHDFYEISGDSILMLAINADGTVTNTGSSIKLLGPVGSVAVSPNGKMMYATVTTGTVAGCDKGPCPTNDVIWEINRDPASGALTPSQQVSGTTNLHLTHLRFDASGNYLLGLSDSLKQIDVQSVNSSTGDLTPVAGSPFASTVAQTGEYTRAFEIDASGKFVHAVSFGATGFNPEYVSVFSFSQTTGMLMQIQTFNMTPPANPDSLVVDQSMIFVVSTSNISVFKRDPTTGMLSAGGTPVVAQNQEAFQGAAIMHIQ